MRYLLDTCVVSEFAKPVPNAGLLDWLEGGDEDTFFLSVLSLGEIQKGIEKLPKSKRKSRLEHWLERDVRARFSGRTLEVSEEIALRWGKILGEAEKQGHPLPVVDALLGATALTHGLTIVTHNENDLSRTGARMVDPWTE